MPPEGPPEGRVAAGGGAERLSPSSFVRLEATIDGDPLDKVFLSSAEDLPSRRA